jgi:hypothetical protein
MLEAHVCMPAEIENSVSLAELTTFASPKWGNFLSPVSASGQLVDEGKLMV